MMPMPAPNISHDQKSHVAPHFSYLDQTNLVVVLMMQLASHDADAGASVTICQKSHIVFHFDHLDVRNSVVPLMALLASCNTDTSTNGII